MSIRAVEPTPPHPTAAGRTEPVALLIPARNEAGNLPALFDALATVTPGLIGRVILCDNGSTDATAALAHARGAEIVCETRRGYGSACLAGLRHLRDTGPPAVVAFLDADMSDDPAQLPRLCEPILSGRADLVIGCRPRLAEPGSLTFTQRFGNWLAVTLTRLGTGVRYGDLGPMRAVRWSSLEAMHMADRTWGWTVEMQYKAAAMGLRTLDVDVPYRRRRAGRSQISGTIIGSAKAGWKILWTIAKLRIGQRELRRRGDASRASDTVSAVASRASRSRRSESPDRQARAR